MYTYKCTITRVVDGDTIDVLLDLGFNMLCRKRCRVSYVDTPETRTRDEREKRYGHMAADRVRELLPEGTKCLITTERDKQGHYGRVLADFHVSDTEMLSEILLRERLAVPYVHDREERRRNHLANWDWLDARASEQTDAELDILTG